MKILVGILHCAENEYQSCIEAIHAQTYKNWQHFVIHNLPNKDAHNALYLHFMENSNDFDLFLKLDADMVIKSKDFFSRLIHFFSTNPDIDQLQIPVYDHFTQRDVFGQITYRNTVKWNIQERNSLFTDYGAISRQKAKNQTDFKGDIHHCPNPTEHQSWHFGLHKGTKVTQLDFATNAYNYSAGLIHWDNIMHIFAAAHGSEPKKMHDHAIAGAMLAIKAKLQAKHIDYSNSEAGKLFESYKTNPSKWKPTPLLTQLLRMPPEQKCRSFGLATIYFAFTIRNIDLRLIKNGIKIALKNKL